MTDEEPALSVIIPVRNGAATIGKTLRSIAASNFREFELIVIDDASTDASVEVVRRDGSARILANETRQGAHHARNRGAEAARGEILFFTDADVEIREDTLDRVRSHFATGEGRRAVIGLYSLDHPNRSFWSRYKNAWIHYSYVKLPNQVDFFFTAAAAVTKRDWEAAGGLPVEFSVRTGGGDLAFGHRLRRNGVEIRLDKEMKVVHHHDYTLAGLLANDFRRAYGYTLLALSQDRGIARVATRGFANVPARFAVSTILAAGIVLAVALTPFYPDIAYAFVGLGGIYAALNAGFLTYVGRRISPLTALAFLPILFLDHLVCGFGILCGLLRRVLGRPRRMRKGRLDRPEAG